MDSKVLEVVAGIPKTWRMTINSYGSPLSLTGATASFRAGYSADVTPVITCDESDGIDMGGFLAAGLLELTISGSKSSAVETHRFPVRLVWQLAVTPSGGSERLVASGDLWIHPKV